MATKKETQKIARVRAGLLEILKTYKWRPEDWFGAKFDLEQAVAILSEILYG